MTDLADVDWRAIFFPDAARRLKMLVDDKIRLAHYTTAATAASILQGRSIWMRNSLVMNDYSEIEHGLACLNASWKHEVRGERFKKLLNEIYPDFGAELEQSFNTLLPQLRISTFLTSLSEHTSEHDQYGRLSMWRAYGGKSGVALVLNTDPFTAPAVATGPYSSPVEYLDAEPFGIKFNDLTDRLAQHRYVIAAIPKPMLMMTLTQVFQAAVLCTKHPGFEEEREWRVLYNPKSNCPAMSSAMEVVNGHPQAVYKLPLKHDPENGLFNADIPALLNRLLIGPTDQPLVLQQAFGAILYGAGVDAPFDRIGLSMIPLRSH